MSNYVFPALGNGNVNDNITYKNNVTTNTRTIINYNKITKIRMQISFFKGKKKNVIQINFPKTEKPKRLIIIFT